MCCLYFESISVINKGSEGPYLVILWEVPKMSKTILQSIRKPKLAIWEYLKTIKSYWKPYKKPNKTNKSPFCWTDVMSFVWFLMLFNDLLNILMVVWNTGCLEVSNRIRKNLGKCRLWGMRGLGNSNVNPGSNRAKQLGFKAFVLHY